MAIQNKEKGTNFDSEPGQVREPRTHQLPSADPSEQPFTGCVAYKERHTFIEITEVEQPEPEPFGRVRSFPLSSSEKEIDSEGRDLHVASRGSVWHDSGKCKPCVWYWKKKGCLYGRECHHCHSCARDVIKMNKKNKREQIKIARESEKALEAVAVPFETPVVHQRGQRG